MGWIGIGAAIQIVIKMVIRMRMQMCMDVDGFLIVSKDCNIDGNMDEDAD